MLKKIVLLFFLNISLFAYELPIDKKIEYTNNILWTSHYQMPNILIGTTLATAIYFGNIGRLGVTAFKALDAVIMSSIITTTTKHLTRRQRPRHSDESDNWFQALGSHSFPSGHTSSLTAIITPFILQYAKTHPLVFVLSVLTMHQMVGRVSVHAHWQSDVIIGMIVGILSGIYGFRRKRFSLFFGRNKLIYGLKDRF
jgi:undecaprenyl-diphosphatase